MSAFQQALAAPSGSSFSIRGAATGAPSTRGLTNALRSAGISRETGMEVEGGAGRPARTIGGRGRGRASGPLDQSSRPTPRVRNDAPYNRPPRAGADRDHGQSAGPSNSGGSLASRLSRGGARSNNSTRRAQESTPPLLRGRSAAEDETAHKTQRANLSNKLRNEGTKEWLRARVIAPGAMDMSKLPLDAYLKQEDIIAPGHRDASPIVGAVFWKLIDIEVQKHFGAVIHTLSLADNELRDFGQLDKLAHSLPHLRALDLSNNPVKNINELDVLLARGEKKGNATAGAGSLKSLVELKLNGCTFRENLLGQENGEEKYQHEILRRFPGLLILDGVNLNRIVFPIERKPKVVLADDKKRELQAIPLSFPVDVQGGFVENELAQSFVMAFCAKFFPLFDSNRQELISAYAPNATLSASCNTLQSRSFLANKVAETKSSRPPTAAFAPWTDLPGRNLFRVSSALARLHSLKSPMDNDELRAWWAKVPATKHPLEDPTKWCVDTWVLDGEGSSTKLCAMIQGQFQEMPSGCYRSFSRTFILADAIQGTTANQAGWPAQILSDTLVVHQYMSSEAFDDNRSVAKHGALIIPPQPVAIDQSTGPTAVLPPLAGVGAVPTASASEPDQNALVARLRQATGMNVNFATMCMVQNGWDYEVALRNYGEIKGTIPAEAYQ